jgi:hypothetical protein
MARYSIGFALAFVALVACSKDEAAPTPAAPGSAAPEAPAPAGSARGEEERRPRERGEWRGDGGEGRARGQETREGPRPEHS